MTRLVRALGEADARERRRDPAVRLAARARRRHREVLAPGQVRVEARLLDDRADARERRTRARPAAAARAAACCRQSAGQPEQHPDQRRLAGAVRPEVAEGAAGRHAQVDAVDGDALAEALGQPVSLDDERAVMASSRSRDLSWRPKLWSRRRSAIGHRRDSSSCARTVPRTRPPSQGGALSRASAGERARPRTPHTACTRSRRPSLRRMLETCVLTVVSLTNEALGELGVRQPAGQRGAAPRSSRSVSEASAGGGVSGGPGSVCAKRSSSRRVTVGASSASPARHHADRLDELRRLHVLEQEAARSSAQRLEDVLVEVERGQDQDATPRRRLDDAAASPRRRRARACARPSGSRPGRCRHASSIASRAVRRLADDLEVVARLEDHAEAAAHERLVVARAGRGCSRRVPPSGIVARTTEARRSGAAPAYSSPPNSATRSRIPMSPRPRRRRRRPSRRPHLELEARCRRSARARGASTRARA